MTHHIKEFTVHDYKGIHELTLKDIAPINILTGDNNSGKTSLLELLATTDNPLILRNWLPAIRINSSGYIGYYRYSSYFDGFYNLFPCNQEMEKHIEYEWEDMSGHKHKNGMTGTLFDTQLTEMELNAINGFWPAKKTSGTSNDKLIDVQGLQLLFTYEGLPNANKIVIYNQQRRLPEEMPPSADNRIIFISPVEHENYNTYLNKCLRKLENKTKLVNMLKIFDSEIDSLQPTPSDIVPSIVTYYILSKRNSQSLSLPLSAYGDGMKKALLLLSALLQAENGILLIDEFETGIHTSCMDQVFNLLLENALKLNIQIFMTSHSKEAISKVLRLAPNIQDNIALYTLFMYEGKNYVRRVDCQEAIKMQDELGMELR